MWACGLHLCDGAYGPVLVSGKHTVKLWVLQKVGYFLSSWATVSQGFFSTKLISYLILMPAIILWDAFSDWIDKCQCLVNHCSHNTLCVCVCVASQFHRLSVLTQYVGGRCWRWCKDSSETVDRTLCYHKCQGLVSVSLATVKTNSLWILHYWLIIIILSADCVICFKAVPYTSCVIIVYVYWF
jgi:hypothetical protein